MNRVRYLLVAVSAGLPFGAPINGADRANPTAANAACGRQLQQGWSEGLMAHPASDGSEIHLMMYTYSKAGLKRIDKQFAARPELMTSVTGIGTGPGGAAIFGVNPIQPWLNAPSDWFEKVCAIASEGRSDFVELGLYSSSNSNSPSFVVRASTGVRSKPRFWIGLEPPPLEPAPPDSKKPQTH